MAEYYVYSLSYPDGTPFYIGKGKGNRINDHGTTRGRLRRVNAVLDEIRNAGGQCLRAILRDGMTEDEAFSYERLIISEIGRAPNGPLVNSNDGGHGGRNPSEETRQRLADAARAQPKPPRDHMVEMNRRRGPWTAEQRRKLSDALKGRKLSEDTKLKLSAAARERKIWGDAEHMRKCAAIRNANTSEETRRKLSEAAKKQVWDDERRRNLSEAQKGRVNSAESNAKRAAALKGRKKSPEHLAAIAAAKAAKKAAGG